MTTGTVVALSVVGGAVAGAVGGYFLAKKRFQTIYQEQAEGDIEEMRAYFESKKEEVKAKADAAAQEAWHLVYRTDEDAEPEDLLDEDIESRSELNVVLKNLECDTAITGTSRPDLVEQRVSLRAKEADRKFEAAIPQDGPYLISIEEFSDERREYSKISLTWFEIDTTLMDDREHLIDDVTSSVGNEFHVNFGFRSQDDNVVYVRNDKVGSDFEITRDQRSYQEVVLGFDRDQVVPSKE